MERLSKEDIQQIAAIFSEALKDCLTVLEWNEMVRLNDTPEYEAACASHNYVDVNYYLLQAYKNHTLKEPSFEGDLILDLALAHDYAAREFFKPI